jgi:hypothetical protein
VYLSKKAVLEWFGLMHLEYSHNAAVSEFIESGIEIFESGAFDADNTEIQRLRAALDWVKRRFEEEWTYELGTGEVVEEIIVKFEEALSTTTEPINAEKVERVREGDGNDA